jgi:MFS transporter, FSR family, fosmidomycin resistance protein
MIAGWCAPEADHERRSRSVHPARSGDLIQGGTLKVSMSISTGVEDSSVKAFRIGSSPPKNRGQVLPVALLAATHGVNDSYAFVLPALLPVLLPSMGISLALAGVLVMIQQITSSFIQPFFGHAADRAGGGRWMSWSGVLLCGLAASALGLVSGFPQLAVLMFLNGLGTALWHPVSAGLVAQSAPPDRRGFWMSLYISSGNFGLGLGPLMVGFIVTHVGLGGTWVLALPALLFGGLVWKFAPVRVVSARQSQDSLWTILKRNRRILGALIAVVTTRSWAVTSFQTFLPLYAASRGADPQTAALTLTAYLVVGAMGGVAGGWIADRLGRDRVIIGSMLLSAPFSLALAFQNEVGPLFWICAAMSGFLLNGSFVVLTVRGQESIPGSVSMMSGMMLGLTVGLGAIIVTPMAAVAEQTGLAPMLIFSALLAPLGAGLMKFVPKPPSQTHS